MEDVINQRISQRLTALRKHLSDRLDEKLTTKIVGEQCGLNMEQVYRLEHGLNGTPQSLAALLLFYRGHGYSYDWIMAVDNSEEPIMSANVEQLRSISQQINIISQGLVSGCEKLKDQLGEIGYDPLTLARAVESEDELSDPADITL